MSLRVIAGVDPSAKKIAIVATVPLLNVSKALTFSLYGKGQTKQTPESIAAALTAMEEFVAWVNQVAPNGERHAWVESPLVGRGGVLTTMKQAYVGGVIRAVLVRAGFTVHDVNQSTWKARLGAKGIKGDHSRAVKADVKRIVRIVWPKIAGLIGDDSDLADAAAIAIYGGRSIGDPAFTQGTAAADARPAKRRVRRTQPRDLVRATRL